jgi:hypothetical protein
VSGAADSAMAALTVTSPILRPRTFSAVMRPLAFAVGRGDFALAADHRRIAINLLAATLNSTAAFSIAVASSGASTAPSHTALLANL